MGNEILTTINGTDLSFVNVREYERTKHVHLKDFSRYVISGKVIQVIKKPKLKWL